MYIAVYELFYGHSHTAPVLRGLTFELIVLNRQSARACPLLLADSDQQQLQQCSHSSVDNACRLLLSDVGLRSHRGRALNSDVSPSLTTVTVSDLRSPFQSSLLQRLVPQKSAAVAGPPPPRPRHRPPVSTDMTCIDWSSRPSVMRCYPGRPPLCCS